MLYCLSNDLIKRVVLLITLLPYSFNLLAQQDKISKTRFVAGISGPELVHAGVTYKVTSCNQFGLSLGAGPSWGMIWNSISLEHRWYIGKNAEKIDQKTWFFRQGTTYFPSATKPSQHFTVNLTVGKDIPFKNTRNGFSIDGGVFYLPDSERSSIILVRSLNLWPALRFQFYFSL